jgi:hypothetical protein
MFAEPLKLLAITQLLTETEVELPVFEIPPPEHEPLSLLLE